MTVDVLCLDDVTQEVLRDRIFGASQLKNLIRLRHDWRRPTILTTSADLRKVKRDEDLASFRFLVDSLSHCWSYLEVRGDPQSPAPELDRRVFGEGSK
jgi:hypothetical protein